MPTTCAQIRAELVDALGLDLVGPLPGSEHAAEVLPQAPSRWYLTGFLVPFEAGERASDDTAQEQIAVGSDGGGVDDDDEPEGASARKVFFPSSIGVSVIVPPDADDLEIVVRWGDYHMGPASAADGDEAPASQRSIPQVWRRTEREERRTLSTKVGKRRAEVPSSGGLAIHVSSRLVRAPSASRLDLDAGSRVVSLFLVNHRDPAPDERRDEGFVFQASLEVRCEAGFCPRPNVRGRDTKDGDEELADLQYRDVRELAVGHGVATHAHLDPDGRCRRVETTWLPRAEVEKVIPAEVAKDELELGMEALAAIDDPAVLVAKLRPLTRAYGAWLDVQAQADVGHPDREPCRDGLMARARAVRIRIDAGIDLLASHPQAFEAFRIANAAMGRQARQRARPDQKDRPPRWYPFQLAFLLLNLRGIAEPQDPAGDREIVDLLFFPTGGGKTEAYLGLAAFTLVLRRLENPGVASAGVTVLMRYTLRLLTLDQLQRAAALICALELARQADVKKLGPWPFEIGLWVGQAATPNRMGRKGDDDRYSARARTIAFQNASRGASSPIPLETCPWCDTKFTARSFVLLANGRPNDSEPTDLRVVCTNRRCDFSAATGQHLPVLAVDEPIYRRLPAFLIATVDKFAALPWVGETGALFGKVDRHDAEGFYGAATPHRGRPLDRPLLPPDLIIQDELHLISGPLGSMAGLYETVLEALSTREVEGKVILPKIVASTATVRRADRQIRALFARSEVEIFPPPGPDVRDSFFARTVAAADPAAPAPGTQNARLYVGVAAPGRSMKVTLLRSYLALLSAAQRCFEREGGPRRDNPVDPYMTLLGYFNSLRELGGSRRIVGDEVRSRLAEFARRRRVGEARGPFASRTIEYDVLELTSREPTSKVAETKRRLALSFDQKERVDVALATNMISVGLDITRLGLMVVLGQPKTAAEYIQATSRVGRDASRPGLVVALLNVHKPRDRSHLERFEAFHASFYRAVEATSVTPFAPRAIERGLPAVTVALARHLHPSLTPAPGAARIEAMGDATRGVAEAVGRRFAAHDPELPASEAQAGAAAVAGKAQHLLDDWKAIAHENEQVGAGLQYQREQGGAPPLLRDPLDPDLRKQTKRAQQFKARRSLRDVEPSVNLWVRTLDGVELEPEEDLA